jgi:hypothetical protein
VREEGYGCFYSAIGGLPGGGSGSVGCHPSIAPLGSVDRLASALVEPLPAQVIRPGSPSPALARSIPGASQRGFSITEMGRLCNDINDQIRPYHLSTKQVAVLYREGSCCCRAGPVRQDWGKPERFTRIAACPASLFRAEFTRFHAAFGHTALFRRRFVLQTCPLPMAPQSPCRRQGRRIPSGCGSQTPRRSEAHQRPLLREGGRPSPPAGGVCSAAGMFHSSAWRWASVSSWRLRSVLFAVHRPCLSFRLFPRRMRIIAPP